MPRPARDARLRRARPRSCARVTQEGQKPGGSWEGRWQVSVVAGVLVAWSAGCGLVGESSDEGSPTGALGSDASSDSGGSDPDPSSPLSTTGDPGADSTGAQGDDESTGGPDSPPAEPDENYCGASWVAQATKTATPDDVDEVLATAVAGDVVLLADGDYEGFSLAADGTEQEPIVVRAENPWAVRVAVDNDNIVLAGSYGVLACMHVVGNSGGQVSAKGEHTRVTRNIFSDPGSLGNASIIFVNAPFVRVDHNDIGGEHPLRRTGIRVKGGEDQQARIDHNYIHDSPHENGGDSTEYEGIWISTDPILDFWIQQKITIDHNYFANWKGDNEVISIKSSGNVVANNTLVDSWEFSVRGGEYNLVKNNVIDNGSNGITTYGLGHMIIGNELSGSSEIEIRGGKDSSGHTASQDVVVAGNIGGTIYVGGQLEWDHPAVGTKVGANEAPVELWFEQDTVLDYRYEGDVGIPMGVSLDEVGPEAP